MLLRRQVDACNIFIPAHLCLHFFARGPPNNSREISYLHLACHQLKHLSLTWGLHILPCCTTSCCFSEYQDGECFVMFSLLPLLQVEMFSRENAQLQGLLQQLQSQPQAVGLTSLRTSCEALMNGTAALRHESSAAGAPNQG